jgi:hypothetical protein
VGLSREEVERRCQELDEMLLADLKAALNRWVEEFAAELRRWQQAETAALAEEAEGRKKARRG